MTTKEIDPEKWGKSPEAQALASAMACTQAAMTPLVTRCGQALGRLPGGTAMNDDERSILIGDAHAATEDLPEILLAMAAAVMIGLGSDDEHQAMPGLLKLAAQNDGDNEAARLEALASKVFTMAQRRRHLKGARP